MIMSQNISQQAFDYSMASQQLGNNYNNKQHASAVRNYYYERETQDIGVSRMISPFRNRVSRR